jgi:hypothetical protein
MVSIIFSLLMITFPFHHHNSRANKGQFLDLRHGQNFLNVDIGFLLKSLNATSISHIPHLILYLIERLYLNVIKVVKSDNHRSFFYTLD